MTFMRAIFQKHISHMNAFAFSKHLLHMLAHTSVSFSLFYFLRFILLLIFYGGKEMLMDLLVHQECKTEYEQSSSWLHHSTLLCLGSVSIHVKVVMAPARTKKLQVHSLNPENHEHVSKPSHLIFENELPGGRNHGNSLFLRGNFQKYDMVGNH